MLPDFWFCALAVAGFEGAGGLSVVDCDAAAGCVGVAAVVVVVVEELGRSEKEALS